MDKVTKSALSYLRSNYELLYLVGLDREELSKLLQKAENINKAMDAGTVYMPQSTADLSTLQHMFRVDAGISYRKTIQIIQHRFNNSMSRVLYTTMLDALKACSNDTEAYDALTELYDKADAYDKPFLQLMRSGLARAVAIARPELYRKP